MIYIFSIEGNIGSGKSTIIKNIKNSFIKYKNFKIIYLQEPVDIWESIVDENNKNIIEHFYGDNVKYGFSFQMLAFISRNKLLNETIANNANENIVIITERSIFSDKNVFAKMLYKDKSINEIEYQIYNKWFNEYSNDKNKYHYIYVDTSAKKCCERVKKRSRKGETIPLVYLKKCQDYHDQWLHNEENILTITGEEDFNDKVNYNNILNIITKYIKYTIMNNGEKDTIVGTDITINDLMNHPFF